MRAMKIRQPAGLDQLELGTAERVPVGPGQVRVRLQATSLNYHDYMIATGGIPAPDGRIPMSDGAGEIVEVGERVSELAIGDHVMSTFFPRWLGGELTPAALAGIPGDQDDDGYAREEAVAPAAAFTRVPAGYTHAEAATLPCAALTAWHGLFAGPQVQPGDTVLVQGTGGVSIFALQFARPRARTSSRPRLLRPSSSACANSARITSSTTAKTRTGERQPAGSRVGAASITSWRSAAPARCLNRLPHVGWVGTSRSSACWRASPARCRPWPSWPATCASAE